MFLKIMIKNLTDLLFSMHIFKREIFIRCNSPYILIFFINGKKPTQYIHIDLKNAVHQPPLKPVMKQLLHLYYVQTLNKA